MQGDLRYEVSWTPASAMDGFDFDAEFWTDNIPYEERHFPSLEDAKSFALKAQRDDYWGEARIYSQSDQGFSDRGVWFAQWETEEAALVDESGVSNFEPY